MTSAHEGQATEEVKVQPWGGGKSTGDRRRHTAGGRSLMPCHRVGQRTLARTASAATRSRTNDPANIQSKNITGSSFRVFLVPWKRLANLLFTTDERGQARF